MGKNEKKEPNLSTLKTLLKTCEERGDNIPDDIIDCIDEIEAPLRDYIRFVDEGLRSHGKPESVMIKYKIYKKILGVLEE